LVTAAAGRVPDRGEILLGPGEFEYEVLDADPRRIKRVKIRPLAAEATKPRLSLPTPETKPGEPA
jgi:CBS domain containing-hemolysin-like protein